MCDDVNRPAVCLASSETARLSVLSLRRFDFEEATVWQILELPNVLWQKRSKR